MLSKIQAFFEKNFVISGDVGTSVKPQLNLAVAALLVEMILQDGEVDTSEINEVKQLLTTQLGLSEIEANKLYQLAEEEKNQSTDYHQFTCLIAKHYTQRQKVELIESLWRVAFADKVLDKYEEHMVRKISDLIHVSHKDFIQARLRVEAE